MANSRASEYLRIDAIVESADRFDLRMRPQRDERGKSRGEGGGPGKGRAMIAAPVWIWRNDDKRRDKVVVATPLSTANKIALIIDWPTL